MPEYLHPGVFVEEVSSGVRPIEGVGTSTAAFIGVTAKGVPNKATFVTSWPQFVRKFGYLSPNSFMPYAVSHFFDNGGKRCYIVRALNQLSSKVATRDLPDRETSGGTRDTLRISAKGAGAWGNGVMVLVQSGTANPASEFKLVLFQDDPARSVEVFDNLSMAPAAANYVETEINNVSEYIEVKDLGASVAAAAAKKTTVNPLAASVPFAAGGEALTIEAADGTTNTITFTGARARGDVVTAINTTWAAFNVTASLDAASKLTIAHNSSGFDKYFTLSGAATDAGRPLEGLAGFAQGSGTAIGAIARSVASATFDTTGGNNVLNISVHGDALPTISLTANAAATLAAIVAELNAAFLANARGLVTARQEGNRVVIRTTNQGSSDSSLVITGAADTVLQFRRLDRGGAAGSAINGSGRSQAAFVQSAPGPWALPDNSNFTITVNNASPAAASQDVVVTVNITSAAFPNLAAVTPQQLATVINGSTNAAGNLTASAENGGVVVRQARSGNYYTLKVDDGLKSPNIRLRFDTTREAGYVEGDPSSPYLRPASNVDASGVNRPWVLQNGDDGAPVTNADLIGTADLKTGLHALDDVTDVNFITIPGAANADVIGKAVGYCTIRKDCFFIADGPGKAKKDDPITEPDKVVDFFNNQITVKTSYGAVYYPWLEIADDVGAGKNPTRFAPPSGFVAGMYARIDNSRGVWKAPAGTEATVIDPLSLEYSVTDSEQDILNPIGVNVIRRFPASGIVIWGARTLAAQSDPEYRYVPIRRYAIYLEQSIYRGTQWVVFEPNDQRLWSAVRGNVEDFMLGEFRKGALAGAKPSEAFLVKCDADLNPPSEVNAGRLNVEVRFAPLRPAEFVIIRISQMIQRPQS